MNYKISSKNKQNNLIKNLFYSKNESWWLIGFSMLMAGGIMIEPQLICSSLLKGQLSDMWLYWSAGIGSAFSVSFFAHLWRNVPVKTENEFLFFRFSGLGAKVLHSFRSLYLGLLIVPFIIAFSLLAYSKIASYILGIEPKIALILLTGFLIILTFFNSFRTRLRIDFILFLVFILLFTILISTLFYYTGGLTHLSETVISKKYNFSIIPSWGSKTFNAFIVFVLVQWWSASILDYPDMNGQKLMATNNTSDLVKSVFLPSLSIILLRIVLFTLPFMAVCYGFTNGLPDTELAVTALFVKVLPPWMLYLVLALFLIPFVSFAQNNQNWGGSLLVENFYKHSLNPTASAKKLKKAGTLAMIYILIAANCIALYADSLIGMTKFLFAITAGVGPVFMLRWYWWRINAWSQLSAMLSALLYPPILDLLFDNNKTIHQIIVNLESNYNLDYYPIKLIILTIVVCVTWVIITFMTAPTDRNVLQIFATTIKPGGFWKGFENSGKSFSKTRILAWFILILKSFLVYFIFWNFLIGNYIRFIALLIVFLINFYLAYKLIQKANKNHNLEFK
jgi:SSS family solute:Na+ symporter